VVPDAPAGLERRPCKEANQALWRLLVGLALIGVGETALRLVSVAFPSKIAVSVQALFELTGFILVVLSITAAVRARIAMAKDPSLTGAGKLIPVWIASVGVVLVLAATVWVLLLRR
jgi:hypothetical protein